MNDPLIPDAQFGKLKWRCRRGMKELDFLLLRYLRDQHAAATSDERAAFVEFLELPDPDIARYLLTGDVPTDARHAALCRALLTN
ncbi:MAG: succinate dehydrogenase assembly factor 2 [Pseudomonadota bacterium]